MSKLLSFMIFFSLTINTYSQKINKKNLQSDPISIINKIIDYGSENRNSFIGLCKVGYIEGESFFNFLNFSNKYPNIIVNYSVLGKNVREGGILKNVRFVNSGNFNTRIILADWINFDKNHAGSGKFELSVLDKNDPNKFYLGIKGSNWSYYINIKLKPERFQEIINLLTYSGEPNNFIEEQNIENYIVEQKPEFVKGDSLAWGRYLKRNLNRDIALDNNAPVGEYLVKVQFTINRRGEIIDVIPILNPGYGTFEELKRVLMNSPTWSPGIKNNRVENYIMTQSMIFGVIEY